MYNHRADYIDIERLTKAVHSMPAPKPLSLAGRLLLSVGMIGAPVVAFFFVLGVDRLVAAL